MVASGCCGVVVEQADQAAGGDDVGWMVALPTPNVVLGVQEIALGGCELSPAADLHATGK